MTAETPDIDDTRTYLMGNRSYRAVVGPPGRYDLMGASQFSLLFHLGLRDHHRLLDFGCGSLRLGRLAIPYLRTGGYCGVEPEAWLVEEGFARELGQDAKALKQPRFDHNADYRCDMFGVTFDYVIAQSVLSHTGHEPAKTILSGFEAALAPGGLILANWMIGGASQEYSVEDSQWVYPECVPFARAQVVALAAEVGLVVADCPWPHAGLTWFVLARAEEDLPSQAVLASLAVPPPKWA